MSFAWPWMLLLGIVPLAGAMLHLVRARPVAGGVTLPRVLRATAVGGRVRLGQATGGMPWRFWLGMLLLVAALGRPQWSARPDAGGKRGQVVIALDLSRSMLATDALPSRLERARTIATRFVAQSPASDIGLIGFAGQAYLLAAPSADRALIRTFLPAVWPEQMVAPGSDFASLLTVALHAFDARSASRILVLLSDGEADATPWRQLLPGLRAAGIHVVAVGVGTPAGAHIRIGARDLADAAGGVVTSRLDMDSLRDLARATGGADLDAARSPALADRVRAIGDAASAAEAARPGEAKRDRFAWFLAPALLLLLWSALAEWPALPRLMRSHRRWSRPAAYASAASMLLMAGPRGEAVKPPPISLELHGSEPDPMLVVKDVVARMLTERPPRATDYMALARAAVRYGEVHRQHAHVLQEGVMRDGLTAIDAGRALDPGLPGWAEAHAKLIRLLRPPRPIDRPDKGDADPANDPVDAKLNTPVPDPTRKDGKQQDSEKNSRDIGGSPRSKAEQAEWNVPSLVRPLYALQKLRGTDRPGELFRLMQMQSPLPKRTSGQTW